MYELLDCDQLVAEKISRDKENSKKDNVGVMFVHSDLDEYQLDVHEFRVYGHITRRASGRTTGRCFASNKTMAEACGMSIRKIQYALRNLESYGMIRKDNTPTYKTNCYRLTPRSSWDKINGK